MFSFFFLFLKKKKKKIYSLNILDSLHATEYLRKNPEEHKVIWLEEHSLRGEGGPPDTNIHIPLWKT